MIVPLAVARAFQRNAQAVLGSLSPAQDGSTDAAPIVVQPGGGGAGGSLIEEAVVISLATSPLRLRCRIVDANGDATGDTFDVFVRSLSLANANAWAGYDPPILAGDIVVIGQARTSGRWVLLDLVVGTC
ncbi:MAG: hypothetical protein SF069_02925 [Phycisphaerae bacterium]|nr:hypothetical protein [Phycisphaerae bacterium]